VISLKKIKRLAEKGLKYCNACKEILSLGKFHDKPSAPSGKVSICKICNSLKEKERRHKRDLLKLTEQNPKP